MMRRRVEQLILMSPERAGNSPVHPPPERKTVEGLTGIAQNHHEAPVPGACCSELPPEARSPERTWL
jgi:hypothetical protein